MREWSSTLKISTLTDIPRVLCIGGMSISSGFEKNKRMPFKDKCPFEPSIEDCGFERDPP